MRKNRHRMMEKMKFARDWLNDPTKDPHGIGRSPYLSLFSSSLKMSRLCANMIQAFKKKNLMQNIWLLFIKRQSCHHIETSQLICKANRSWTHGLIDRAN